MGIILIKKGFRNLEYFVSILVPLCPFTKPVLVEDRTTDILKGSSSQTQTATYRVGFPKGA